MALEGKILRPPLIKLGKENKVIIQNGNNQEEELPLLPGVFFDTDSFYGFVVVSENNQSQDEVVYSTECPVQAVGMRGNAVAIYEYGKKSSWLFSQKGKLLQSIEGNPSVYLPSQDRQEYLLHKKAEIKDPVVIKVEEDNNIFSSSVLADDKTGEFLPTYPGVVLGGEHYGFTFVIYKNGEEKVRRTYPTQNRIYGIESNSEIYGDICVHEDAKYFPWKFNYTGNLITMSSYNPYSRRDIAVAGPELLKQVDSKGK